MAKPRPFDGYDTSTVVGPRGTQEVCDALFTDDNLETRLTFTVRDPQPGTDPSTVDGFDIDRAPTAHSNPGYAYRFDECVTIAGNTAPTEPGCSLADDSAVFVRECAYPDGTDAAGHSTPAALGRLLAGIDIGYVLFRGLFPETERRANKLVDTGSEHTTATVIVATDRTALTIA